MTIGPAEGLGVLNIGEGAHITAASSGGPRYDARLSAGQRADFSNGIWLCRTCHSIVDGDAEAFPAKLLRSWKSESEALARQNVTSPAGELIGTGHYLEVRESEIQPLPRLRFIGVVDVDKKSVAEVIEATEAADIVYSDLIEKVLVELQQRDKDPDAHMARNPRRSEIEPNRRGEIAASYHAHNKRLLRRTSLIAEHNSAGLSRLLEILGELHASPSERRDSVSTFGALAALRMVLALKDGYGWRGTELYPWFEALAVETTIGPSLLPLVPKVSHTGSATFGFLYWCAARVGSERAYDYAMFPYKQVLPLFLGGVRGDRPAFFEWVLPQIFDSSRLALQPEEGKISLEDWEPFLLHGSYREWWSPHQACPWGHINEPPVIGCKSAPRPDPCGMSNSRNL